MKTIHYVFRACYILTFFLISASLFGQSQRLVKMTGSTGYDCGGMFCFRDCIHYSKQTFVDGNGGFLDYIERTGTDQGYRVRNVYDNIGFRVYCDRHGDGHYSAKISVPRTGASQALSRKSESNGCVSCYADATAYFYDGHNIEFIQDKVHGRGNIPAGDFCVSNVNSNLITVKVAATTNEFSTHYFYLIAEDENGNQISRTYISSSVTSKTFSYKNIFGIQEIYGTDKSVYFRVLTDFGVTSGWQNYKNEILSPTRFGPYRFYREMPSITDISVQRTACRGDVVKITLDPSVINLIDKYHFRAKPRYIPEKTSNIVHLTKGAISGNTLTLSVAPGSQFLNSIWYTFQAFGIEFQDNVNSDVLGCATIFHEYIDAKPPSLTITANPQTKATFDGTTYHTSKHNLNDALIHLDISDMSRLGKVELDYTCNFNSTCHSYCSYCPDMVDVTNSLGNVDYNTKSLSLIFVEDKLYFRAWDDDGCLSSNTSSVTLSKPSDVTLNQPTAPTVPCHVNNTGSGSKSVSIQATCNGGIGNYTARLYSNSGSLLETKTVTASDKSGSNYFVQFSPRGVGRYRVRITDSYGVYKDQYVDVISNPEVVLSATSTDLTCFEGGNGSIQLTATNLGGGTPTYTLSGRTESLTNYQNLSAGNYTATVINYLGCQDIVNNITVGQPNDIIIDATGSKIARYGDNTGTIDLVISEGTGDFDYILYKGSSEITNGSTSQNATITELYDGYYRVEVIDDNGCPQTQNNIRVRQPDAPLELSFSQQPLNVDCNGNATGEVYPTATGGWGHYQYGFNGTVNGTSNTIGGLTATGAIADTVFVVDSAGVIEKLPLTITEPSQLFAAIDNIYNLKCFEDNSGAVKLNISGGTKEYRVKTDYGDWENGDSISNLPIMDNEPVYVLDANDCPSQVDVTITQPDKIAIAVDTVIDAFCGQDNGGISTLVSGGREAYAFNWTYLDSLKSVPVNSNIIGGIYSGQYKLLLTDAHGCTDSLIVSISDTDGPEILAYTIDSISCFDGSDGKLTIQQVDGGMPEYAYYLDGIEGDSLFEGLGSKSYHFRLLDKKGCKLDRYYTIPEPKDISIVGTVINPVCHDFYDGFIASQINGGNGGYNFDWSNGSDTKDLQNLNSGNYTLTVTDKKACKKSESFEVIPPLSPTANLDHNVGVLCTGNSLELDGGDFVNYKWFKDAVLVSEDRYLTVDQTGQYTLRISNQLGCIGVDTFDLEVSDTPLDAAIIVKDSAMIDEVVEAIDVTWPVPDSVQWYFDYPVELVDNNSWMQQFSASTSGVVNVTLRAWYGGCFSDSSKTVTIYYEEGGIIEKSAMNEPLILGYKAYPNPNDGNFFVGIELSREADIRLQLFNVGSASVVDVKEQFGLNSYDVPFNLYGLRPGVYVIVLIAERERQKLKIVIE